MTEPLVITARPRSRATQSDVRQQRAVYLIAAGRSDEEIARECGVAAITVKTWRTKPEIEQAVTEAIAEHGRSQVAGAFALVDQALATLAEAMTEAGKPVSEKRIKAAETTIRAVASWQPLTASQRVEHRELVHRVEHLLRALQEAAQAPVEAASPVPAKPARAQVPTVAATPSTEGLTRAEKFRQQGSQRTPREIDADREIARMARSRAIGGPRVIGRSDGWGERR